MFLIELSCVEHLDHLMRLSIISAALTTIFLIGGASAGYAQGASRAQRDTLKVTLDSVRITARPIYSAASDARYRAADFALRPRSSAQDMLRVVPGLVIAQHAGGGKAEQIFLRGFDADHGTDINISVDNAPVNMVSHGHGQGYADLHFIIPETIERVDVVKGPYFARFGDLTTAGAVAFATADSLKENLIKLEGGLFGTFRAVGLVRAPLGTPGTSAYIGTELYGSRGYFDEPQDLARVNLFAKLRAALNPTSSISASLSSFSSGWDASGQIPERAIDNGSIGRFGAIDPDEGGSTSRTTAIVKYASNGSAPLMLTGSYTDYRFRLFSNFTFFAGDSVRGDMIEQTDSRTILALKGESDILYELSDIPMRTRLGADLRSDEIDVALYHDSARVRLETTRSATIAQRQIGPYIEQEIIFPWASLLLGLRADYFSFDVENRLAQGLQPDGVAQQFLLSPKANLSIPVTDDVGLFLNSGFGFHSNDARDVVENSSERTLPRAFGAEVGLRYGAPDALFAGSISAWRLDLESELVYIGDEGVTEASGRTTRAGIDLEARLNPAPWLALGVDATISRGRSVDEPEGANYIPLAPNVTLSGNALFRFDDFSVAARLRMVGDRPANETNSVVAKGYGIVDLSASYRFDRIDLFINIENLLDAEWNEAQFDTESRLRGEAAPVSELHFTPGTPLSVRGGVGVRL